ncbi:Hypothetical predicted protein [Pelobates cultripes]|uniref:Uncharacterized protein n=1 Tax=Pelobates cultripes TaxID=61616 RepID=A0AAD1RC28_PELCU|nr:Hypothetical predicted protein [Pelobates cultripes]
MSHQELTERLSSVITHVDEIMQQEIRPLLAVDIIEQLHRQFATLSEGSFYTLGSHLEQTNMEVLWLPPALRPQMVNMYPTTKATIKAWRVLYTKINPSTTWSRATPLARAEQQSFTSSVRYWDFPSPRYKGDSSGGVPCMGAGGLIWSRWELQRLEEGVRLLGGDSNKHSQCNYWLLMARSREQHAFMVNPLWEQCRLRWHRTGPWCMLCNCDLPLTENELILQDLCTLHGDFVGSPCFQIFIPTSNKPGYGSRKLVNRGIPCMPKMPAGMPEPRLGAYTTQSRVEAAALPAHQCTQHPRYSAKPPSPRTGGGYPSPSHPNPHTSVDSEN